MRIGFTGTKKGMNVVQVAEIENFVKILSPTEAHHGDCVGADFQFHTVCFEFSVPIFVHPPLNPKYRAGASNYHAIMEPEEYLVRDRRIVDSVDYMLAAPFTNMEVLRSGTWSTIRYATDVGRRLSIVYPDGGIWHVNVRVNA